MSFDSDRGFFSGFGVSRLFLCVIIVLFSFSILLFPTIDIRDFGSIRGYEILVYSVIVVLFVLPRQERSVVL